LESQRSEENFEQQIFVKLIKEKEEKWRWKMASLSSVIFSISKPIYLESSPLAEFEYVFSFIFTTFLLKKIAEVQPAAKSISFDLSVCRQKKVVNLVEKQYLYRGTKYAVWKPIPYLNSGKIKDSNGVDMKTVGREFMRLDIFHLHFFTFPFIFLQNILIKIFLVFLAFQRYLIYFNRAKNVEVMMPYVKYCQIKTNRL